MYISIYTYIYVYPFSILLKNLEECGIISFQNILYKLPVEPLSLILFYEKILLLCFHLVKRLLDCSSC